MAGCCPPFWIQLIRISSLQLPWNWSSTAMHLTRCLASSFEFLLRTGCMGCICPPGACWVPAVTGTPQLVPPNLLFPPAPKTEPVVPKELVPALKGLAALVLGAGTEEKGLLKALLGAGLLGAKVLNSPPAFPAGWVLGAPKRLLFCWAVAPNPVFPPVAAPKRPAPWFCWLFGLFPKGLLLPGKVVGCVFPKKEELLLVVAAPKSPVPLPPVAPVFWPNMPPPELGLVWPNIPVPALFCCPNSPCPCCCCCCCPPKGEFCCPAAPNKPAPPAGCPKIPPWVGCCWGCPPPKMPPVAAGCVLPNIPVAPVEGCPNRPPWVGAVPWLGCPKMPPVLCWGWPPKSPPCCCCWGWPKALGWVVGAAKMEGPEEAKPVPCWGCPRRPPVLGWFWPKSPAEGWGLLEKDAPNILLLQTGLARTYNIKFSFKLQINTETVRF